MRKLAVVLTILASLLVAVPAGAHGHQKHHAVPRAHRAHKANVGIIEEGSWGTPGWSDAEWETELAAAGFTPEEVTNLGS